MEHVSTAMKNKLCGTTLLLSAATLLRLHEASFMPPPPPRKNAKHTQKREKLKKIKK
jgi:hypothetical protein